MRILQRVRRFFAADTDRGHAPDGSISLPALHTAAVTLSGGEPLLHPEVEAIIRRIRHHGMISGIITNGYLLTPQKIRALNEPASTTCKSASITSSPTMFR